LTLIRLQGSIFQKTEPLITTAEKTSDPNKVVTAENTDIVIFWFMTPYNLENDYQCLYFKFVGIQTPDYAV
jgi:hypothetical protein